MHYIAENFYACIHSRESQNKQKSLLAWCVHDLLQSLNSTAIRPEADEGE